ncbi:MULTISPECIES: polyprenyl synthetase family protein [Derxia]|uniref:Octaprenyl diphosphate synthase n=1 Tax=Derxia gummosa DSM 723 TaxID=1121388 RepID=A0A9U5CE27_9BURK|nr:MULTISPECIES: polyprenyl synthetase family protein [Derxia]
MSVHDILSPISEDMRAVDRVIRDRLHSGVALVETVAEYIVSSGGKRLRPALLLMMAGALGYRGTQHHVMAAVVELIHTSTLLHDDVVDESSMRRGRKTANAAFGNAASVLVGDFLYSRSFQMMLEPDDMQIMRVLADATNTIAEGEVLQLMNCNDPDVEESQYMRVVQYKTACLFEASARIAAILAGTDSRLELDCAAFGRHLGTAFQLIDDVLDYSGDAAEIGKNLGDDLREGKPTMPMIYLRDHGAPEQRELVRQAIVNGDVECIGAITEALRSTGALEYTRQRARAEAGVAAKCIEQLPSSQFKQSLILLCAFAVERTA